MLRYVVRRLVRGVSTLVGITLLVFVITRAIGDPAIMLLPADASNEQLWYTRESLGLNKPLPAQFVDFLGSAAKGDFGPSIHLQTSSRDLLLHSLGATALLATAAMLITTVVGVSMGIVASLRPRSWVDNLITSASLVGISLPEFWLALVFILVISVALGLLPTSGYGSWQHLLMPALALSARPIARVAQVSRSSMLDELGRQYVVTARSKGLAKSQVVLRHVVKNAGVAMITIVGIETAEVFAGRTIIVETIFGWPGAGWLAGKALFSMDFPLIQTVVLWAALVTVVVNLLVDLAYAWLNPRIRYA